MNYREFPGKNGEWAGIQGKDIHNFKKIPKFLGLGTISEKKLLRCKEYLSQYNKNIIYSTKYFFTFNIYRNASYNTFKFIILLKIFEKMYINVNYTRFLG